MRTDLENIYTLLPFDNNVKFNIYNQMYKKHYSISKELKEDIETNCFLKEIIQLSIDNFDTNISNYQTISLYILYCDLVQEHSSNEYDDTVKNNTFDEVLVCYDNYHNDMNRIRRRVTNNTKEYLTNKIKQLWRQFNPTERRDYFNGFKYSNYQFIHLIL
jgi:hypothetical protein